MVKTCPRCQKEFVARRRSKYCSKECGWRSKAGQPVLAARGVNRKPLTQRSCKHCGTSFWPDNARQHWCLECGPDDFFRKLLYRYGLSKQEYDFLLTKQNGTCALCEKKPQVVDHDHKTDKIRGLLCHGCNSALNRVEVFGWVAKAFAYLLQDLGLKARYRR